MSTPTADDAIWTRSLSKTFHTTRAHPGLRGALRGLFAPERVSIDAVTDVDLTVAAGELVMLLGPNGAGKSTLIKMLTGVIRASAGEIRVAGVDPRADRVAHARAIGTVFGQRSQLWWDLPIRASYEVLQSIYDIPPAVVAPAGRVRRDPCPAGVLRPADAAPVARSVGPGRRRPTARASRPGASTDSVGSTPTSPWPAPSAVQEPPHPHREHSGRLHGVRSLTMSRDARSICLSSATRVQSARSPGQRRPTELLVGRSGRADLRGRALDRARPHS